MHLMKLLRDQGLHAKELHCIFHALVVTLHCAIICSA